MTDIVGWRVDDVVTLIRGAKDSVVRLDILPAEAGPDGKHKLVTLVRNKISLEQQAARKSLIKVKDGAITRQVGRQAVVEQIHSKSRPAKAGRTRPRSVQSNASGRGWRGMRILFNLAGAFRGVDVAWRAAHH